MPRPDSPATRAGRAAGALAALLAVAVVATAGAPSVITIRSGDTLWDLAREHRTTVAELRRLNDLPGNGAIYAGRTLRVPGTAKAAAAPARRAGELRHPVRRGDTLSHLAVRYGVTQQAIAQRNGLRGGRIYVGQVLSVPGARRTATVDSVPTTNAGYRIPEATRRAVAENRRVLASRSHPSKDAVRRMVATTARRYGVPASLAVSVAYHESGFQQRVVSGVNAIGVMQVLPSTGRVIAAQHGVRLDLLKAQDNVTAGVLLLRQLLRSTGSADRALAGYYQGLGSIARKGLLPQTHAYIRNINVLRQRFANG